MLVSDVVMSLAVATTWSQCLETSALFQQHTQAWNFLWRLSTWLAVVVRNGGAFLRGGAEMCDT